RAAPFSATPARQHDQPDGAARHTRRRGARSRGTRGRPPRPTHRPEASGRAGSRRPDRTGHARRRRAQPSLERTAGGTVTLVADWNIAFPGCAVVVTVLLVFKLRHLRTRWESPRVWALCGALFFTAVAVWLGAPPGREWIDIATGVPNLGWLLADSVFAM